MDRTGKITVPCKFDDFDFSNFKEGVFVIKKEGHYGLIDEKGNLLTSVAYDYIFSYWTSGGLAKVRKDGKFGVLNRSGKEVIPCIYSGLELRYDGVISVKKGEKWYNIDEKGKSINPNEYDKTRPLLSGFTEVERDGKYGLIDMSGNLEMFKENGRYGFFDSKGTMVIPPIFLECTHFNQDGLALTDRYVLSIKNKPAQHMSYIEASEKGYADAQFFRAIYCFRKGENEEGRKWLDKAVQQGLAVAQHMMGSIYRNGWYGVEKNKGLAFLNESMAAQKGNIPAQMELGLAYGLADQYKDAVEWLRKAAESGNSEAHIYLGMCYEEGLGVERDYNEALKLYDWSFERDHNKTASEAYRRVIEKMKQ
jgi:tetratricopeptide (TPR) repeat protein